MVPKMAPFNAEATAALNVPSGGVLSEDLVRIISRSVRAARDAGQDYLGQCRSAASALLSVRPDVTLPEALRWVMDHHPD